MACAPFQGSVHEWMSEARGLAAAGIFLKCASLLTQNVSDLCGLHGDKARGHWMTGLQHKLKNSREWSYILSLCDYGPRKTARV